MKAYKLIRKEYGDSRAERSGVRLINHIDEGILILDELDAYIETIEAFCLHPLVQSSRSLKDTLFHGKLCGSSPSTVVLAMLYREQANSFLSNTFENLEDAVLPPLWNRDVRQMLIADKVQNYKDLELFNTEHEDYERLKKYFRMWFVHLGLDTQYIKHLIKVIS
jgi:hypothetical protein